MILADQHTGGGNILQTLLFFALIFGVFYMLLIRPQAKRRKEAERMQKELGVGAKIITVGGLYGTVIAADDESVELEIAPGVNARFARPAIGKVLEQGPQPEEPSLSSDDVVQPTDK